MLQKDFKKEVHLLSAKLFRVMPWRVPEKSGSFSAYKILVSECMLQQTQVSRVMPKYELFMTAFPDMQTLAAAQLADVIKLWQGLGYNRRAKYLHDAAKRLVSIPEPWSYENLVSCRGIGPNTAKAVRVYAYDLPEVFIETNIRTVYIHYFFDDAEKVSDTQILEVLADTIDTTSPRKWYWALMDIGASLKSSRKNGLAKSTAYKKQSAFKGSARELRGRVLAFLSEQARSNQQLQELCSDERLQTVLESLQKDELIHRRDDLYYLGV